MLGGGFALAEGVKRSGLSDLIGAQLHLFGDLPLVLIQGVCILLTMCITSVTSNTVTASILIPVVNGLVRVFIFLFCILILKFIQKFLLQDPFFVFRKSLEKIGAKNRRFGCLAGLLI